MEIEDLQHLYELAVLYHKRGAEIWNSIGLDNPSFTQAAAEDALREYSKCEKLLALIASKIVDEKLKVRWLGLREFVLGEAAAIETYVHDEWNDDDLKQIIDIVKREINHRQEALSYFLILDDIDDDYLFERRVEILSAQGRQAFLSARLAGRENDIDRAKRQYSHARETYEHLMRLLEENDPKLASIKENAEDVIDTDYRYRESKVLDNGVQEYESPHIRWTARVYRISTPPIDSKYESMYLRCAANHYVAASLEADFTAASILQNRGEPEDIEKEIEESTRLLYLAMAIFPANLEFHQDLLNRWRGRGEMFGCPMKETEKYYHVQCPLAIMHHLGAWYISPTFEYRSLVCSVCGKDAVECEHYPGQVVDGKAVQYKVSDFVMPSISLVDVPEDPACRIEWISFPKELFPHSSTTQQPRMQCRFCHPEIFKGETFPFHPELPDVLRDEVEKKYEQIMNSTRMRSIQVAIPSDIDVNRETDEKTTD